MSSLNKKLQFDSCLDEITFAVVDTETNGFTAYYGGEIIEIAVVNIVPGFLVDLVNAYSSLIYTDKPIHPSAYSVHGISHEMLQDAPSSKEIFYNFSCGIKDKVLIAHNARFDISFIKKTYKQHNIKYNIEHVFDTVKLSRKLNSHLKSHSLDSLIDYYGVSSPRPGTYRHRALYDADCTAIIAGLMLTELHNRGYYTLWDLYRFVS